MNIEYNARGLAHCTVGNKKAKETKGKEKPQ